jgi:hypothetical protein
MQVMRHPNTILVNVQTAIIQRMAGKATPLIMLDLQTVDPAMDLMHQRTITTVNAHNATP